MIQEAGQLLFGRDYKRELADALGVSRRSVQRWSDGFVAVPPGVWKDLEKMLAVREAQCAAMALMVARERIDDRVYAEHFSAPRQDEK